MVATDRSPIVNRIAAALVALLVVSSAGFGLVAADSGLDDVDDDDVEPADEIYVTEEGAVLVYEDDPDDAADPSLTTAEFGADVSTGLVNGFVEIADPSVDDVEGELGIALEGGLLSGSGELVAPQPDELDALEISATGVHDDEESAFDVEFAASADGTGAVGVGAGFLPEVETSGEFTAEPDSFDLAADATLEMPTAPESEFDESLDLHVDGHADGFTVTVEERRQVRQTNAARWETEDAAADSLETQVSGIVAELDGSADVTLDSHDYEENVTEPAYGGPGAPRYDGLEVAYTVEVSDVRDGLDDLLAEQLRNDPTVDPSQVDVDAIADGFADVEVDDLSVTMLDTGSELSVSVAASVANYEEPFLEYASALAEEDGFVTPGDVEELENVTAARSAADFVQTASWDADLSASGSTASLSGAIDYDTENWAAYVSELEDRGIPHETEATFDANVTSDGDEVSVDVTADVHREDLVDGAVDEALATLGDDPDDDAAAILEAFDEVEVSKADVVFGDGTVEVRAAGKFDDLTAVGDAIDAGPDADLLDHVYGEGEDGNVTTYVSLSTPDATAEDYADSAFADDDTEVHSEGEWDRDFPEMDAQDVASYLDVEPEDDGGDGDDGDGLPGFGAVLALAALLAVAAAAARRGR